MGSRADWVISRPITKNSFTYTNEARNAARMAPTFDENAKITVSDLTENTVKITFPAANHDDFVHSYRVEIKNKSNAAVQDVNYLYFSDFCKGVPNMADSVSYSLSALTCGTDYDINVYAIESFGKESKPLHTTIQTVKGTIDPNDPKPTADVLNVSFISGTAVDTSPFATVLTPVKQENATAVFYSADDSIHHTVLHCNNSALKAALSSAQLAKIKNQYSMETVVKLQRTDVAQSVFANTESAGISLEITDTGRIEMWARIGNAYQKAGETENYLLQAGQYYHLMGTYDGTRMTLYVNGQKVATKEASGTVTYKDLPMYIGGDTNANGDLQAPMSGEIALARLYSIGLSEQQVANLYRAYDDIASGVYPTKAVITGADYVFAAGTEAVQTADFSVSFQDDEGHPVTVTDTENIVWSLRAAGQGVSIPQDSTGETVRLSVTRDAAEQKAVLTAEYALPDATTRKITAQKEILIEAKKTVPVEIKISGEDVVRAGNGTQTRQYSATAFDGDGQPIDDAEFTWTLISAANGVGLSAAGMLYVNDTAETGETVIEAVLTSDATLKARKTISIVAQTVTQTGAGGGRGTHSAATSNIGAIVEKLPNDSAATDPVNAEIGFRDVPQTHWAREWIQKLVAMDIIAGDAEGTLRPDENITREETVKVLLKALHAEITETEGEVDENTSDWAKSYVLYAKKSGIVMGDENGAFHGRNAVSRVDAMVMIARAMALTDGNPQTLKVFADCAKIPNYAVPCVAKLVEIGAVKGYEDGSIGADKKMTRAELFALIARMLG